jgi:hypothetical protein
LRPAGGVVPWPVCTWHLSSKGGSVPQHKQTARMWYVIYACIFC